MAQSTRIDHAGASQAGPGWVGLVGPDRVGRAGFGRTESDRLGWRVRLVGAGAPDRAGSTSAGRSGPTMSDGRTEPGSTKLAGAGPDPVEASRRNWSVGAGCQTERNHLSWAEAD
ncbi:hypothetical protein Acsp05_41280 [Actinokineospora sp. NBRC 105648]|nr:hypothetical protein Acsp05_41280 [Actinokineospora sp. NBRC 105648]